MHKWTMIKLQGRHYSAKKLSKHGSVERHLSYAMQDAVDSEGNAELAKDGERGVGGDLRQAHGLSPHVL